MPNVPTGYVNTPGHRHPRSDRRWVGRRPDQVFDQRGPLQTYSGPFTITSDGATTVTAKTYDNAGNVSDEVAVVVRIDTTAPVVSAVVPVALPDSNGYVPGPASVSLSAADAGVGGGQIFSGSTAAPNDLRWDRSRSPRPGPIGDRVGGRHARQHRRGGYRLGHRHGRRLCSDSSMRRCRAPSRPEQPALLSYTCTDPVPGSGVRAVDGCTVLIDGQAPSTAPTLNPVTGRYETRHRHVDDRHRTVQVTATDNVGFVTTVTKTITIGYRTCLNYNPNQPKQVGSAYQVSIRLCDANGVTIPTPGLTLTALTVDGTNDPGPGAPGGSNPAYTFAYDGTSYTYTVKTTGLSKGRHDLYFTVRPVPNRSSLTVPELQALATNSAPFTLK